MSGHHHEHGENCDCHECGEKREMTSIEEAGGVAVGLIGHMHGYNADAEARFSKALMKTGEWVEKESGSLLGHIKAAIYTEEGNGVTLNLTDLGSGVEHHGRLEPCEKVNFNFMAAVLDVDPHALEHIMEDALEDAGLNFHLKNQHHHDHHHGHHDECGCGHDHKHGDHNHDHKEEKKDDTCHCKACEERRAEATDDSPKVTIWDRLRRRKQ